MAEKLYRDPIAELIIKKLEAEGPKALKGKYYHGNLFIIPQNQNVLPAAFVSQVSDIAANNGIHQDRSTKRYQINVAVELKKEWGRTSKAVEAQLELARYLSGMDENFDWLPESIMYVLRSSQTLDAGKRLYIDLSTATETTIQPGVEGRGPGIFTYEGIIEFNVLHTNTRPGLTVA